MPLGNWTYGTKVQASGVTKMRVINIEEAGGAMGITQKEEQKIKDWNSYGSILHLGDGLTQRSQKKESEKDGRKVP